MNLTQLQESLVKHQKQKDTLLERLQETINESRQLQDEHNQVIHEGQLIEGGILLLTTLIEQYKEEHDDVEAEFEEVKDE